MPFLDLYERTQLAITIDAWRAATRPGLFGGRSYTSGGGLVVLHPHGTFMGACIPSKDWQNYAV